MKKHNFAGLTYEELLAKRKEIKQKYMELRFQFVVGHVESPIQKRIMRRQIAALNTFIRQKELASEMKN